MELFKNLEFNQERCSMDIAHGIFIFGAILAHKPKDILEVGIGSGLISKLIIAGIKYNQLGNLECVDNFKDGERPQLIDYISENAKVHIKDEKQFILNCNKKYDFIISDADHANSHNWLSNYIEIANDDAFLLFHDTNNPNCKNLLSHEKFFEKQKTVDIIYHFKKNSLANERCDRGLLVVKKKSFKIM